MNIYINIDMSVYIKINAANIQAMNHTNTPLTLYPITWLHGYMNLHTHFLTHTFKQIHTSPS